MIALTVVVVLGWPLAPAARAVDLVANRAGRVTPNVSAAGIPVTEVHFSATDGVRLAGHAALQVLGDKGYISQAVATDLRAERNIDLVT